MIKIVYYPSGVCSEKFEIEIDSDVIKSVKIFGGCQANLTAISNLLIGKKISDMIPLLKGIKCQNRSTSCPDQIAQALENKKGDQI